MDGNKLQVAIGTDTHSAMYTCNTQVPTSVISSTQLQYQQKRACFVISITINVECLLLG